ncbi:MAG: GntR family transcriptional regulator [Acidimicrobiales bacterium]|jgi:DNA-binding transcriptional regulator YhcF (GntR family)
MIVRIDPESAVPVYEQIRAQIVLMVASGTLVPGTQLPTIRQLASDLGLAKGTVSKAYEALVSEGAVESNGRHGTVVAPHSSKVNPAVAEHRLRESALQLAVTAQQVGASKTEVRRWLNEAMGQVRGAST